MNRIVTIFHGSDTRIGYIEETQFGQMPASPQLQPITLANLVTRGLDPNIIRIGRLGSDKVQFLESGQHEPFLDVEFRLQNETFPSLIETADTKTYSIVVLDATGTDIYRVYEGCRPNTLDIQTRVGEEVAGTLTFVPRSVRDEASISGLSWAAEWSEAPFLWHDGQVELLTEVKGETPTGSGTGPYQCTYYPFADRDEDGTIDDTGDITVYDDGSPVSVATVDSSAGTFTLSSAPSGAVTVDYVYETDLLPIEIRMNADWAVQRAYAISQTGDKAREIRETRFAVSGDFIYDVDGSTIVDAVLAGTEYWGIQFKLGAGENGTLRFRAKNKFKWGLLDVPSDRDTLITGRVSHTANNFVVF